MARDERCSDESTKKSLETRLQLKSAQMEVMLVTSRRTRRWIIPKRWPYKRRAPPPSAAREAYEEAGVVGRVGRQSLGSFSYEKRLRPTSWSATCMCSRLRCGGRAELGPKDRNANSSGYRLGKPRKPSRNRCWRRLFGVWHACLHTRIVHDPRRYRTGPVCLLPTACGASRMSRKLCASLGIAKGPAQSPTLLGPRPQCRISPPSPMPCLSPRIRG